ncbi:hypothetical protein SUGI_0254460 [Cryptomeria japonica]|nr:hypothetical protein SUGI_0254460 [Cryptomeria japonica]
MLKPENGGKEFMERIANCVCALSYHLRTYFWFDFNQLNNIYRYKIEEYSHTVVDKFNAIPDSIPERVFDFMTMKVGYFIGKVNPARMDFRSEEQILNQIKVERCFDVDAYFDVFWKALEARFQNDGFEQVHGLSDDSVVDLPDRLEEVQWTQLPSYWQEVMFERIDDYLHVKLQEKEEMVDVLCLSHECWESDGVV